MFGVSESREPIKGEFAKKLIEEVAQIREQKMKKDYISNEKFDDEVDKTFYNMIAEETSCSSIDYEDETLKLTNDTIIRNTSHSQKEILKNIMTLYNNGEAFDCDITASQLKFYLKNRGDEYELPVPKHLFDVYPQSEDVKQIVPFQKIPMPDNSLGSIVFDPPFVISPKTCKSALEGKDKSCLMFKRFSSFYPVSELYYNYYWWLKESYRTLKEDGILVVKCMSTVSGGYQHNSEEYVFMAAMSLGFYCVDKFILNAKARLISGAKYKKQCHSRKYTSVFYVFQKNSKMLNKYNYFELINKMKESDLEGMVWELK